MVKFAPVFTVVPAPALLLFALDVMLLNAAGRIEKRSVEQPIFAPWVMRTRTSRAAATLETAVNVTVALPDAQTGDGAGAMLKITVAHVVRQLVASVIAPVLSRASRSCTVIGFVLNPALTPF